jgi:hypothetical protein
VLYKGRIRQFKGLIRPFQGLIRTHKGLSWAILGLPWAFLGLHMPGKIPRKIPERSHPPSTSTLGFCWDFRWPLDAPFAPRLGLTWACLGIYWPFLGLSWAVLGYLLPPLGLSWASHAGKKSQENPREEPPTQHQHSGIFL